MAFNRLNFNLIGPNAGTGPKKWTYETADALTEVDDSGYFDGAADLVSSGDTVWAYSTDSSTGREYRFTNTAGVITTTGLFNAA